MTIDITEHLPLVTWVVNRYYARWVGGRIEREDLISAGYEGLIKAGEKFDPALGFAFSTYAVGWVRSAMTNYVENHGRLVRVPRYLQDRARQGKRQLSPEALTWLDAPHGRNTEQMNHDFMGSDDSAQRQALTAEDVKRLLASIKDERVRHVVTQVYLKERTLDQAGEHLGVSRERVRQLVLQGLDELRRLASGLEPKVKYSTSVEVRDARAARMRAYNQSLTEERRAVLRAQMFAYNEKRRSRDQ